VAPFSGLDDPERLIARLHVRDVAAFEIVYDGYHKLVYGIAFKMLRDGSVAEDVTQTVFLKLWSSPQAFRGGNLGAWLARVTQNRALDLLRGRTVRPEAEIPLDFELDCTLEETVFARIDGERVREALASLPSEQRDPIELGFFAGVTHEQIALLTATPLGTVKTRIRAGLRRLRSALEASVK